MRKMRAVLACSTLLRRQLVYRGGTGVGRADLQEEIRPQPRLFDQRVLDELLCPFVGDDEERADEVTVIGEDLGVEVEDAHGPPLQYRVTVFSFSKGENQAFLALQEGEKPTLPASLDAHDCSPMARVLRSPPGSLGEAKP